MSTPDVRRPQIPYREMEDSHTLSTIEHEGTEELLTLNLGPHHPATHGVLRLLTTLEGEVVHEITPLIGYLHTGIEKTCEAKFYQQVVPLTDRIDYLSPMTNNTAYALAVEKLLQLEIPDKAQWLRVLFNELMRVNSFIRTRIHCALGGISSTNNFSTARQ